MTIADGAIPSPNIWHHESTYETENRAVDPDGVIEQAMRDIRPWAGAALLDIGCGSGFHLPRFADAAHQVIGVEPHARLVSTARRRTAALPNVSVRQGAAQGLPVPDACIDVVHARWAYFFDDSCAAGLAEIDRVVRRGAAAFLIDNDPTRSTFGRWFSQAYPKVDPVANELFFARHGYRTLHRDTRWSFRSRADFESVVRIEFPSDLAETFIAEYPGTEVDYAVVIRVKEY